MKKGSLELSVNAIVILVLAITMLGLGLTFMREKFGSASNLIDDVMANVGEQIKNGLINSDSKIGLAKTEYTLGIGKSEVTAIGIKNTEALPADFTVRLDCLQGTGCNDDLNTAAGPHDSGIDDISGSSWFTYNSGESQYSIQQGEIQIIPIKIQIPTGTGFGTYLISVKIYKGTPSDATFYASKEFYITVTT